MQRVTIPAYSGTKRTRSPPLQASQPLLHLLVKLHGQPGWVAALTPLSVVGMIMAASTALLGRLAGGGARRDAAVGAVVGGQCGEPYTANVAVAQPTAAGRVSTAWPSFALIGAYELLMRQVCHSAAGRSKLQPRTVVRSARSMT
jgi:hypothetical protein